MIKLILVFIVCLPFISFAEASTVYEVKQGDQLMKISYQFFKTHKTWKKISAANPGINPHRIFVGQKLIIPDVEAEVVRTEDMEFTTESVMALLPSKIESTNLMAKVMNWFSPPRATHFEIIDFKSDRQPASESSFEN